MKGIINFYKKNRDVIYIIAFSIFFILTILIMKTNIQSDIKNIFKVLRYIVLIPIIFKIILLDIKAYSYKEIVAMSFLLIIFALCFFFTGTKTLFQYFILIIGCRNIEFRKITKYLLIFEVITIATIIILSLIKVIPNYNYVRKINNASRYALGFSFPSHPAIFVYSLTCVYLFYRDKQVKIFEYIILFLINLILFFVTNTKFELVCSILMILFSIVYKYYSNDWINKLIKYFSKYIMIFLTVISISIAFTYNGNNTVYSSINKLLSNRLQLMTTAVKEYGLPAFGKEIDWIDRNEIVNGDKKGEKENVVDNGYIYIILNYGWVFLIILEFGYYKLIDIEEDNNKFIKYIIIVTGIHTFINPQLMQLVYNQFMLLLVDVIFDKNKRSRNGEKEAIT